MSLTLKKLCDIIDFEYNECGNSISSEIRYVIGFTPELLPQNDTVVVVGTYEDLINAPKNLFVNFLCTTPVNEIPNNHVNPALSFSASYSVLAFKDFAPGIFSQGNFHIGFAKEDISVVSTIVAVRKELDWQLDFYKYSNTLYNALSHNTNPQYIVDTATKIFNNPIVVADNAFHVIAHSKIKVENDPLWQYLAENGIYPKEYIDKAAAYNHYPKIYENEEIDFLTDGADSNRYYSRRIMVNKKPIGFISIIEIYQKMDKRSAQLLEVLCNVLSIAIKDSDVNSDSYEKKYMYVLNELLDNRLTNAQIKERLMYANFVPLNCLNVVIFFPNNVNHISPEYLLEEFERLIANGRGTIRPTGAIAMLSMRDNMQTPIVKDEARLKTLLEKYDVHMGISYTFHNLQEIIIYANQARESIMLGKKFNPEPSNRIFLYEIYSIFHMLDRLDMNEYLVHYCNPRILEIKKYDQVHNTDYLHTLRSFFANDMSVGETAKSMHCHRNTIDYRIGKLKDIFNVDLTDNKRVFSYQLSMYILDYVDAHN